MQVAFADKTRIEVNDREEAVKVIKEGLKEWMEPTDHLAWFYVDPEAEERGELPDIAFVTTEHGEQTDAWAVIRKR